MADFSEYNYSATQSSLTNMTVVITTFALGRQGCMFVVMHTEHPFS